MKLPPTEIQFDRTLCGGGYGTTTTVASQVHKTAWSNMVPEGQLAEGFDETQGPPRDKLNGIEDLVVDGALQIYSNTSRL